MANYQNLKAAISAAIRTNGNQEITGQVLQDVLNSIVSVIGANYTFAGVATPATNPGTPDQNVIYLAMEGGTYTNFNGTVLPAGISLLMWNGTWTSETVMCGDGGVFDISVYKSSGGTLATFADLAAALDGGNNIPVGVRKGGMSVKFVCSSDNKYVQYRLMSDSFNTTPSNWQGVDAEPTAGSNNLVKSGGVAKSIGQDIFRTDAFVKQAHNYIGYSDGALHDANDDFYTYSLSIDEPMVRINTYLHLSNDAPAAIAFYNTPEINTSGYMKSVSVRGNNTNGEQNNFSANIPEGCKLIVITSLKTAPYIELYPETYGGVSLAKNVYTENGYNVDDNINEIREILKNGKIEPLDMVLNENTCINTSNKIFGSNNYNLYTFKNNKYKSIDVKTSASSTVNCIVFYSTEYVDSAHVISYINHNGLYENTVEVPENCKLIAISNNKNSLSEPTIKANYEFVTITTLQNRSDNTTLSSKELGELFAKVVISQPSKDIVYYSGHPVSLNIDTLLNDLATSYTWQYRSYNSKIVDSGWVNIGTGKNISYTPVFGNHLGEIRCVIGFANGSLYSEPCILHEYYREFNPNIELFASLDQLLGFTGVGAYINTNKTKGQVVDLTPTTFDNWNYIIAECSEGDIFTISGRSADSGRLWAFIDSENKLIEKSSGDFITETEVSTEKVIIAPKNTAKVVININIEKKGSIVYKGYSQKNNIINGTRFKSEENKFIQTNVRIGNIVNTTPISFQGYVYAIVPCKYGDTFTIIANAGNAGRAWAFVNLNNRLLSVSEPNATYLEEVITAPEDAEALILNADARLMYYWRRGVSYNISSDIKCAAIEKAQIITLPKDKISQPTIDYYNGIGVGSDDPAMAKGTIYKNGDNFCITYGENLIGNGIDIPELTPTGTLAMKYKYFTLNNGVESNVSYGTLAQKGTQYVDIDGNTDEFVGGCGLPCGTINNKQYFSSVLSGDGHFLESNQIPLCVCCSVSVDQNGVTFGTINELSLTIDGVRGRFDVGRIDKNYDTLYYTTAAPYYDGTTYHWCLPVKMSIAYMTSTDGINWTLVCVIKVPFSLFGEITCTKIGSNIIFAARHQSALTYAKDATYIGEISNNAITSLYKIGSVSVRPFVLKTNNDNRKLLFVNTNSKNVVDVIEIVKRDNREYSFYKWFSIVKNGTWYTSALQSLVETDFSDMYIVGGNGETGSDAGMTFMKLGFDNKPKYIDDIPFSVI